MVACELCGKSIGNAVHIKVAGTSMNVCDNCRGMGKETIVTSKSYSFKKSKFSKLEYDLVENYLAKMNSALSKKGINLQQLARGINVKESTLHKYFNGKLKLDITSAKRIGKFFEIELVEEVSLRENNASDYIVDDVNFKSGNRVSMNDDSGSLSLGDLIKKQMNK